MSERKSTKNAYFPLLIFIFPVVTTPKKVQDMGDCGKFWFNVEQQLKMCISVVHVFMSHIRLQRHLPVEDKYSRRTRGASEHRRRQEIPTHA